MLVVILRIKLRLDGVNMKYSKESTTSKWLLVIDEVILCRNSRFGTDPRGKNRALER